ncbi:MAG TPA: hypothetical protein VIX73_26900, partial [Kofleriaceae bacterium]
NAGAGFIWSYKPDTSSFRSALSGGLTYESVDLNSVYVVAQNLTAAEPTVSTRSSCSPTSAPTASPRRTTSCRPTRCCSSPPMD